jgi:hypothetical protein
VRRKDGTGRRVPLQVEIIDDGPGMPPEIAADIFEPFVSGRENGTGLGSRWSPRSSPTTTAGSRWTACARAHRVPHFAARRARAGGERRVTETGEDLTWTAPFSSPMTTARSARF